MGQNSRHQSIDLEYKLLVHRCHHWLPDDVSSDQWDHNIHQAPVVGQLLATNTINKKNAKMTILRI